MIVSFFSFCLFVCLFVFLIVKTEEHKKNKIRWGSDEEKIRKGKEKSFVKLSRALNFSFI